MNLIQHADSPRYIRLNELDNVVVVVNDQGVPAGTEFDNGLVTLDHVPQSHKVNLVDIPEGGPVIRYGQTIGYALQPIPLAVGSRKINCACPPRRRWTACRCPPMCRSGASLWRVLPSRAIAM